MNAKDILREAHDAIVQSEKISNLASRNRTLRENNMDTITRMCNERNKLVETLLERAGPSGTPFEDSQERFERALARLQFLLQREW